VTMENDTLKNTARTPRPGGTAARLIVDLLGEGSISAEQLSRALGITSETLEQYGKGTEPIPLNRQAGLALFVIASLPAFLNQGNRLRQQVAAAITYEQRLTKTHDGPPPGVTRFHSRQS